MIGLTPPSITGLVVASAAIAFGPT